MNKKLILTIIMAIIALLLTMYITSIATSFSVGDSVQLGMGYPGTILKDENGNEVPSSKNLMTSTNFDYFCAKRGVAFTEKVEEYGKTITFYNVAQVEIVGNTAKLTAGKNYGNIDPTPYTETFMEEGTVSNKVFALLFHKIKDGTVTIDEVNLDGTKTGKKVTLTRRRDNGKSGEDLRYTFAWDFGQSAMWRNIFEWQANVATKMDKDDQSLWSKVANSMQSEELTVNNPEGLTTENGRKIALIYEQGKQLYSEVVNEVSKMTVENEYGIEESYYNTPNQDKEVKTRIDENSFTILGPFQYNFVGNIENGKPILTFNTDTASQDYIIGTYTGNTFIETNQIISGNKFYIKVETASLNNVSDIHFHFQIEGISLHNTTTKVYFFERNVNFESYQPVMYIEQEEGYNEPFKDTYKVSKLVDVSLEKLDESGNALKAEGIKFQIKDETNAVVAYFKTDANGNGIVTDANGTPTGETAVTLLTNQTYTLTETKNNLYGYKKSSLTAENVEITGARTEQSGKNIKFTLDNNSEGKVTIKAKNVRELANVKIEKTGKDDTKLENVAFVIKIGSGEYLQLKDNNGDVVTSIKGIVTINVNNKANKAEYSVEYIKEKNSATQFLTDKNGMITINNLEVNKSAREKYDYTAYEIYNPNYGYGSKENASLKETIIELKLNETNQIKMSNVQHLGNLELKKYDEENHSIILPNVEFAIEISQSLEKTHAYLALYNQNGELEQNVKGTVTINNKNEVKNTTNGKEYKVNYYYSDKQYSELTEEEKANLTVFLTGDDGVLTVNNLEVYSPKTGRKYTYKLIETSNPNYGYVADSVELGNIILESDKTTNQELGNPPVYTKISGYVWIENSAGKSNEYDGIYTEGDLSNDVKLTDLYIIENGELIRNPNAVTPVEVKLRDKITGEFIKTLPDEFNRNGKYTFVDVEVEKLANYEVVFVYNGFYYTTIVEKLSEDNGSKVKEVPAERETLNNKFATVKDNSEVVGQDGTINTVEYYKDGHTSTVSKFNFDTTVSAKTTETNYNLKDRYNSLKKNATEPLYEIENINMGIVLREQPKISINSDIYSVLLDFEGYQYNYEYNGRHNYYENTNGDDFGVNFEQKYSTARYTRTVFASDVQAAKDQNKEIKVAVTYKIQLANQSRTLSVMPKQIVNYFDARYEIKAVGLGIDGATHTVANTLEFSQPQEIEGHSEYKSTVIDFSQLIGIEDSRVKDLYITFDIQRDAILDLLNEKSTYHNASEILSYTSYYGEGTSKIEGKQFITDQTESGSIYAGIDRMSQPGNMELALIDHPSGEGTKVLDTTNFEDDTTSAPSLLLEATEARKVSGAIWEDIDINTTDKQKLGDGIYSEGEKAIQNVIVELHKINEDGSVGDVATYSNETQVSTKTDENGNYTFGYYDEANGKYVGVLPGRYVIEYTYNNESYIVENKNIDPNEYKSTIITSEVIKNAFNGQNERWYVVEENNRYSDARDNINLRPEYNSDIDVGITVTNSTYNNILVIDDMEAHTPIMDIGIEFTEKNEADALTMHFKKELKNVDFGIIERPVIDITVEKEITGLEIVAQNGTNIIPKGDPTDINSRMQYVRRLVQPTDGSKLVSAEIESDLLQGAKLNLEYTIKVVNNSDKDYLETDYYYYGTGGITEITTKVKQLVDYLDGTLVLDIEVENQDIWQETTADILYNEGNGFIAENVYNELKDGNYKIFTTTEFEEVGTGEEKSVKLYATRALAISDSIREENKIEILELTGKRTVKESEPGDYVPTEPTNPKDEDKVVLVITPPTGTTVNYILYIISAIATLTILVVGIVVIKKKLAK